MSYFYPQVAVSLKIVWEDFDSASSALTANTSEFNIIPKSITVNINDYTQADTFNCEVEYKAFPFDPRTIRALGISIFIEDQEALYDASGQFIQIVPDENTSTGNVVFVGFADEESIDFDDDKQMVKFEGRDFTALLIDQPFNLGTVSLTTPVQQLIQGWLTNLKTAKAIKVVDKTNGLLPGLTLAKFAPGYSPFNTDRSSKANESYWDVIQDIVSRAALICYIELDTLVISQPRVLYDRDKAKQFVYGKNLKKLEFKRKIGRMKGVNIDVRSLDLRGKKVIKAQIPEEASSSWCKDMGIKKQRIQVDKIQSDGSVNKVDAPFMGFRLPLIKDKEHLIVAGQKIFEEVGRQQIEGSFETKDMLVYEKDRITQFDVTKFRCGTPVEIEIDTDDLREVTRLASEAERVAYFHNAGYALDVAQAFSKAVGKMSTPFYTKAISFSFEVDSGFKAKVDFLNFIEIDNKLVSS